MASPLARMFVLIALVSGSLLFAPAAQAADPEAPGSWRGYAFDTCRAPSINQMQTWWNTSPYKAVGIYTSGNSRACPSGTSKNPNLTASWVSSVANMGWSFIPIHVGYQAPCFERKYPPGATVKKEMSYDPVVARTEAESDADEAINALNQFGFKPGSFVYLDIEWYKRSTECDTAVLEFIDAWTERLHANGFKSGLYSSGSAAIALVNNKRLADPDAISWPDHIWIARWSGTPNSDVGTYLNKSLWNNHERIHQYTGGTNVTHGGVTINIDKNFMDVGRGSPATKEPKPCGVQMSWSTYPTLKTGSKDGRVKTLQCLLIQSGHYQGSISGVFDSKTRTAIKNYRTSKGWSTGTGRYTTRALWTSLLARGSKPAMLKYGSTGEEVWRLQRSLRARLGDTVKFTGVYDSATTAAVKKYRKKLGWAQNPTAPAALWNKLNAGS